MNKNALCLAAAALAAGFAVAWSAETDTLPLLYETAFDKGADEWQPTEKDTWKIAEADGNRFYSQYNRKATYNPPFRSPFHISLLKDVTVGDFVLTLRVRSTVADYPHRDACIVFGYQDPNRFYYAHLGRKPDAISCQITLVNQAPRKPITQYTGPGIPWDEKWHDVKIVRTVEDGTIEIYFDDMKKPFMTVKDSTLTWGRIGLGTFDDTADFDDVKLCGRKADKPAAQ